MKKPRGAIFTLGCRLNTADTSLLYSRLTDAGYELISPDAVIPGQDVDLIIINSCAITAEAEKKSRRLSRKLRREHPEAEIIFTGCAAEIADGDKKDKSGADFVAANPAKRQMPCLKNAPEAGKSFDLSKDDFFEHNHGIFPFRSRAFIKIQEGCENYCSYCIVPYVRGKERSRDFDEVVADCRAAVQSGYAELVLTGVNTCAYNSGGRKLNDLLAELLKIPGPWRIRLSSTEPHPDNLALLEAMAAGGEKICRFLHLSLQHGSDRILREMNRHYDTAEYAAFVRRARELIPDIHLGTDIIVGFPGENEEDFEESLSFIEKMKFANIHIFTYSPRPGTPAASRKDQVPPEIAKQRYARLKQLADKAKKDFADSQKGKILPVIFEEINQRNMATGWSDNYLPVAMPQGEVELGKIVKIKYCPEQTSSGNGLSPI